MVLFVYEFYIDCNTVDYYELNEPKHNVHPNTIEMAAALECPSRRSQYFPFPFLIFFGYQDNTPLRLNNLQLQSVRI